MWIKDGKTWYSEEEYKELEQENKELKEEINHKIQNYWHKIEMKNFEVNRINLEFKQTLEEIRDDMQQDTTGESRECGCDDYAECINCMKKTIIDKINEVLK